MTMGMLNEIDVSYGSVKRICPIEARVTWHDKEKVISILLPNEMIDTENNEYEIIIPFVELFREMRS